MNTPWSDKVFIIAEAGVNHNGDLQLALELIEKAAAAGADAIKFQTFRAENLVTLEAKTADYQATNTNGEQNQFSMLKKLELDESAHHILQQKAKESGLLFFSTAFDLKSLQFLQTLAMPCWKIPSGEITNYPYLCYIAALQQPTILSSGMASIEEINEALTCLLSHGLSKERLVLLHCTTEYPTPWQDVNLRAMVSLAEQFGIATGYSDHTQGIEVAIAAVAMGAKVIEKHFTLDRSLPGPDHKASLEPDELRQLVASIRHIELALGDGRKRAMPSELKNISVARKSIVAAKPIAVGELFTEENLTVKRPGSGISPMLWPEVIGQLACRAFAVDELIEL